MDWQGIVYLWVVHSSISCILHSRMLLELDLIWFALNTASDLLMTLIWLASILLIWLWPFASDLLMTLIWLASIFLICLEHSQWLFNDFDLANSWLIAHWFAFMWVVIKLNLTCWRMTNLISQWLVDFAWIWQCVQWLWSDYQRFAGSQWSLQSL